MLYLVFLLFFLAQATAVCPPGSIFDSDFNKCYQFVSTPKSFLDAEQYCNSLGGHMADISNAFENSYMASLAFHPNSQTQNFWIGTNLLRSSDWSWTSTAAMRYINFDIGQPDDVYSCAFMKASEGTWTSNRCNNILPFMCKISPNATASGFCPTSSPSPSCNNGDCNCDAVCDNGYTSFSGMCYKHYATKLSFSEANATCSKDGGMLAKIVSKEVNDFFITFPGFDCYLDTCPYIGITCNSTDVASCSWADGSPLGEYTNFQFKTPDHPGNYIFAASKVLWDSGLWDQFQTPAYFICEKKPVPTRRMKGFEDEENFVEMINMLH